MKSARHISTKGPRVVRDPHASARSTSLFYVAGMSVPSPMFDSKAAAEAWLEDALKKQPGNRQPRERACLTCGNSFLSAGNHNRMCDPCRCRAQDMDGVVHAVSRGRRKDR